MSAARRPDPNVNAAGRAVAWLPLAALLVGSLAVAAVSSLRPADAGRLAIVFPFWWSSDESLAAASEIAAVTGVGALPFIVSVAGGRPGLASEFRRAGALAVFDGSKFPACLARP